VRMVTGDNLDTAVSIAKEAGIITSGSDANKNKSNNARFRCMTGAEFQKAFRWFKRRQSLVVKREVH